MGEESLKNTENVSMNELLWDVRQEICLGTLKRKLVPGASKECMLLSCAVTEVARLFGSEHSMIQSTCRQNTAMQFLTVWKTT